MSDCQSCRPALDEKIRLDVHSPQHSPDLYLQTLCSGSCHQVRGWHVSSSTQQMLSGWSYQPDDEKMYVTDKCILRSSEEEYMRPLCTSHLKHCKEVSLIFRWLKVVRSLPSPGNFEPSENQATKKWKWVSSPCPPGKHNLVNMRWLSPLSSRGRRVSNDWCINIKRHHPPLCMTELLQYNSRIHKVHLKRLASKRGNGLFKGETRRVVKTIVSAFPNFLIKRHFLWSIYLSGPCEGYLIYTHVLCECSTGSWSITWNYIYYTRRKTSLEYEKEHNIKANNTTIFYAVNQLTNQSIDWLHSWFTACCIAQPTDRPTNQSINQSINQLTNQPNNRSINQSSNWLTDWLTDWSIDLPIDPAINQSINQSII